MEVKRDTMVAGKEPDPQNESPTYLPDYLESGFEDTSHDVADMKRLGKRQEFKVDSYHLLSLDHADPSWLRGISVSCLPWASFPSTWPRGSLYWCTEILITDTWDAEGMIRSLSVGLLNGGFGGLFWVFIGTILCYSSIVASLAEMESM